MRKMPSVRRRRRNTRGTQRRKRRRIRRRRRIPRRGHTHHPRAMMMVVVLLLITAAADKEREKEREIINVMMICAQSPEPRSPEHKRQSRCHTEAAEPLPPRFLSHLQFVFRLGNAVQRRGPDRLRPPLGQKAVEDLADLLLSGRPLCSGRDHDVDAVGVLRLALVPVHPLAADGVVGELATDPHLQLRSWRQANPLLEAREICRWHGLVRSQVAPPFLGDLLRRHALKGRPRHDPRTCDGGAGATAQH